MKPYWLIAILFLACQGQTSEQTEESKGIFTAKLIEDAIEIVPQGGSKAIITQHARPDHRPYLHPILAPNSEVSLTQYSPDHHRHQTGLYWGFTRVNGTGLPDDSLKKWFYKPDKPAAIKSGAGRDYFHHPDGGYWERKDLKVLISKGEEVRWQTVYHLLDEAGNAIMEETQTWTFKEQNEQYLLGLEWQGKAIEDISINKFDYGGMFLRMPWQEGVKGEAINAARQRNGKAEGQRAMWVDVGMEIEGLKDWGHITIFDHPDNDGFPQHWRVDGQLGIGPIRAKAGDWHIKAGETSTFRHQLVAYSGTLSGIKMNELWGDFAGDQGMYNIASLWEIAQEEALNSKFLNPKEAVAEMSVAEGYQVNAYANEPMITQPMAFCWDDRGRMWIAENRDYESRGSGFANSGDSRILILEDTDHDGVADKQTVFLEGIPFPSAIAVGFDGLYLGAPPNLLFVDDADGDDKATLDDVEVLLTGWGIRDRHETINSFHWGPDGWLYGLEGFATPSKIRKPKGAGRLYRTGEDFPADLLEADGVDINGGVWRYHPTRHEFEVVAHGFSNPWGIDYDAKGQLFISACVIPHLFHIVPGGIYQRQGGQHFNPYVYKDIQTIVDHRHRSAHGGARIYQSDAFPAEQRGRLFMANIHEHAVLSDVLHTNGSGFTASHGEDFMLANNAQWIGFSMEVGPEGGLYVLDWHDADICGKQVKHKETGRVYRIMPTESQAKNWPERFEDLNRLTDGQLADLQQSPSDWHARRARGVLQKRAAKGNINSEAIKSLNQLLREGENADHRLRAMWTLHQIAAFREAGLLSLTQDKDQHIRAWAIQLLCESGQASQAVLDRLVEMSQKDASAVVRLYLAASLQRINPINRGPIVKNLITWEADADDPNIPFMVWFAMEGIVAADTELALALAKESNWSMLTQHIARRLVDVGHTNELVIGIKQFKGNQADLLLGMLAGLEGKTDVKEPSEWEDLYPQLKQNKALAETALQISQYFGNQAAADEMLAILRDANQPVAKRQLAIESLAKQSHKALQGELARLMQQADFKLAAIRAVASFDDKDLGRAILEQYDSFDLVEQQAAVQSLSSRSSYGWMLAEAIKDQRIPKADIPPYIAIQLRRVVGNGFVEIWGPIDQIASDKEAQYKKYQRLLSENAISQADPQKGRMVYQRSCYACHKMYGEGGNLGPELTGSNRTNISYLLSNVIEPSSEIQDDYRMVVITTQGGRTYSGNVVAETDQQLTMRLAGQKDIQLRKSEILSKEVSPKSMMPEGLFQNLTEQQILDLVAYMRTTQQVATQ